MNLKKIYAKPPAATLHDNIAWFSLTTTINYRRQLWAMNYNLFAENWGLGSQINELWEFSNGKSCVVLICRTNSVCHNKAQSKLSNSLNIRSYLFIHDGSFKNAKLSINVIHISIISDERNWFFPPFFVAYYFFHFSMEKNRSFFLTSKHIFDTASSIHESFITVTGKKWETSSKSEAMLKKRSLIWCKMFLLWKLRWNFFI